jgi:hypothetical protein
LHRVSVRVRRLASDVFARGEGTHDCCETGGNVNIEECPKCTYRVVVVVDSGSVNGGTISFGCPRCIAEENKLLRFALRPCGEPPFCAHCEDFKKHCTASAKTSEEP